MQINVIQFQLVDNFYTQHVSDWNGYFQERPMFKENAT